MRPDDPDEEDRVPDSGLLVIFSNGHVMRRKSGGLWEHGHVDPREAEIAELRELVAHGLHALAEQNTGTYRARYFHERVQRYLAACDRLADDGQGGTQR